MLELPVNSGRWADNTTDVQKFLFGYIGSYWGQKGLARTDNEQIAIVSAAHSKDVVVLMDTRVDVFGNLDAAQLSQLIAVNNNS